jgi:prolyl-tRNA editing enzyme YbaK/EbsC (Cys-tRNA(Pro) deacylase)
VSADAGEDPGARVRATLDRLGYPYEVMACDPELADTDVFCARYGVDPADSANTIVVAAKSGEPRFAACVLLATTRLDVNKAVRKRLATRRISFASAEQTRALTGMVIGGVTPIGLPEELPVWVDERVMQRDRVVLGGGDRATKIKIAPSVLREVAGAEIVPGLAREP